MGHDCCSVVNCKNTGYNNSHVRYYKFPTAQHKLVQRKKWIAAVKRVNPDGSTWIPKVTDKICSEHFVQNQKSDNELSPSYVPTIFPSVYNTVVRNQITAINRHQRFMKRRLLEQQVTRHVHRRKPENIVEKVDLSICSDMEIAPVVYAKTFCDQASEAYFAIESDKSSRTFVCNRYTYKEAAHVTCEVEIQTDIIEVAGPVKIFNRKQYKHFGCNTEEKIFVHAKVGPDCQAEEPKIRNFFGIDSVKKDEQLLDLAGVTFENFNFLLKRMNVKLAENSQVSKENRLFIFLTKMKTGLTFSALSVIFDMHRTTVSRIFYTTLRHLARATADYVFWPNKADVLRTMPDCFREDYGNTRVIIDCTEFRVESPPRVDDRVFTFSHYKKGFTAKLLVGITPSGFISFKSKVAGGRKSDSQITIESGLINLLEDDDVVLADKGFPQFQQIIDEKGAKVLLIMPPFLDKNPEFTEEETEETYKVAKCRIHVERVMQRIRTYLILNKIKHNLFKYIDDIVHVVCVLVNLQPPIIKKKT